MFDKILEILAALAVAIASAAGLSTAADNVGRGLDAHAAPAAGVLAEEMAALAERPDLVADPDVPPAAALEALERAMELAPDAADAGLQRAWDAVNGTHPDVATAGDAAPFDVPPFATPPVTVPVTTGPPTDRPPVEAPPVPAPPVDTPAGPAGP